MNNLRLSDATKIYVVHLGKGGKWTQISLSEGLLRFNWDDLTFEEVSSAPRDAIRARLLPTAKRPGEATSDSGRLETIRNSLSDDLWVTFTDSEMWWTRLVDGPIERDETSTFRRTMGWSNCSIGGRPLELSGLSQELRDVRKFGSSASVNNVVAEERRRAVLEAIQDAAEVPRRVQSEAAVAQVDAEQREVLRDLWYKLRHLGSVGDVSAAGHGVDLSVGSGKNRWRASMYWSNSKTGNAVSFCIHAGRLFIGDRERGEFGAWFAEQRESLNGKDAESRSSDERLQSALRVGFDYENGLTFLQRFVEAMDPMRPDRYTRWRLGTPVLIPPALHPRAEVDAAYSAEPREGSDAEPRDDEPELDPLALSIKAMVDNAHGAEAESGKVRERISKVKAVLMSKDELAAYARELIEEQGRLCKLSGLPLHFKTASGADVDNERLASLDRINPDGHYERGNLQVVCWFMNRWKGDDTQDNFVRLLELLSSSENRKACW